MRHRCRMTDEAFDTAETLGHREHAYVFENVSRMIEAAVVMLLNLTRGVCPIPSRMFFAYLIRDGWGIITVR